MLRHIAKLGRNAQIHQAEQTGQAQRGSAQPVSPLAQRIDTSKLPTTQEALQVVGAQDDLLILRNGSVVAAIGFGSMSDVLLSGEALAARLNAYRLLLKSVRFDFQLLIGTRPQNLGAYHAKAEANSTRLDMTLQHIDTLTIRMPSYLTDGSTFDGQAFAAHFGFDSDVFFGTPGQAHDVAQLLCNSIIMSELTRAEDSIRRDTLSDLICKCDASKAKLKHWQHLIQRRNTHLALEVEYLRTPVRTFAFVMSYNPRIISGLRAGPLDLSELDRAGRELASRCAELQSGLRQMRLPHWRISHQELLDDIQHFYHPAEAQRQHTLSTDRSVAMRLATVR